MSDCCSTNNSSKHSQGNSAPNKHICPSNGKPYTKIPKQTLFHHLKSPWHQKINTEQSYYFCNDATCDVTYFGEDNSTIEKSQLREVVGVKEKNNDDELVCYCFGITFAEARKDKTVKDFVVDMTKQKMCACDTRNPSGRCCLKDFPKN